MRCVQVLSALALNRLRRADDAGGDASAGRDQTACDHLERALRQANARAWLAVEVLLAGNKLWERAQLAWERQLENEFYRPLRFLLNNVPLNGLTDEQRRNAWRALRAALETDALTSGSLGSADLAAACHELSACGCDAEALDLLAADLEAAGFGELRDLVQLRYGTGEPFVVVLIAALVRHAVDSDPDLFDGLLAAPAEDGGNVAELGQVASVLDRHRDRLDSFLEGLQPAASAPPLVPVPRRDGGFAGEVKVGDGAAAPIYLQRGDAHRLNSDYVQAVSEYSTALRFDPFNARALIQRGQMYVLTGQWQEAIADFTAALQLEPANPALYHQRGKALFEAGDLDGAIVNFSETLRLDPSHAWAHHDSGEAYAARKDYERALADYSESIRLNPLLTVSYLRRGEAYAAMRSYERAVADYNNALRLDPHNPAAYQCRGAAYRELGKLGLAENDFTRALELDFANARLYYERGLLFQRHGNQPRALLDFNAALTRKPDFAEAYFRRAVTYQSLGEEEHALADLGKAIRLDPQHAAAHNSRGMLFATRNELEHAFQDLSEAVQIEPRLAEAFVNRAKVLSRMGRLEEALADCDEAITQNPHLTEAYLARGSVLGQQGEFQAAVDEFSRALRLGLRSAAAYYLRSLAYLKLDDTPRALADLTRTLRIDPEHARAYAQRAAIRQASGQHELALVDLAQAVRLDRSFASAFCNQAALFHTDGGKHDLATAFFTVTLALEPRNAEAEAGRVQAWRTHLAQAKQQRQQEQARRRAAVVPVAAQTVTAEVRSVNGTAPRPVQPTMEGPIARGGSAATELELPALTDEAAAAAGAPEDAAHHAGGGPGADDTSFVLNVPGVAAEAPPAPTSPVFRLQAPATEDGLTLDGPASAQASAPDASAPDASASDASAPDASAPDASAPDTSASEDLGNDVPAEDPQASVSVESQYSLEELRAKSEAEQALRAQLAEEYRRKQEETAKEEAARDRLKAAKEARKKKARQEDEDDGRLPLWKKGVIVAASLFILYWSFGAIRSLAGIFYNPNAPEFDAKLVEEAITVEELHKRFRSTDMEAKEAVVRGLLCKQPKMEQDHYMLEISGRGMHAGEFVRCELKPRLGNHQMMLLSRIEGNGTVTVVGTCLAKQGGTITMNKCLLVQVAKGAG